MEDNDGVVKSDLGEFGFTQNLEPWDPAEALKSLELEAKLDVGEDGKGNFVHTTERMLVEAGPAAIRSIVHLASHSTNEATRLKAATYITDRVFGRLGEEGVSEAGKDAFDRFFDKVGQKVAE